MKVTLTPKFDKVIVHFCCRQKFDKNEQVLFFRNSKFLMSKQTSFFEREIIAFSFEEQN